MDGQPFQSLTKQQDEFGFGQMFREAQSHPGQEDKRKDLKAIHRGSR